LARRCLDGPAPDRHRPATTLSRRSIIVATTLATVIGCGRTPPEEAHEPEMPTIVASTGLVARRLVVDELIVHGAVTAFPNDDVKVSSLVAGRLTAVLAAEGDAVSQGQVIAEIDRRPLEDQRRQVEATIAQSRAAAETARANLDRNQKLFARGIAAGKEVEDARAQLAAADASLEQATAALNTVARQLDLTSIRSPIDGSVVKRLVNVGEQVDGTANQAIAEIANIDRVELAANVPASQLSRIRIGHHVLVSAEAFPDRTFQGTVLAIAPAIDATTNAALVRVRIANAHRALRVGMFASARVQLEEHPDALVIPPAALVRDTAGAAVYVVDGDTARRTPVQTGLEKSDAVEILSGLSEGQLILTSSVHGLGERVKIAKPS
jgi:membrane fusion protein, multidrug efflux system